MPGSEPRHARTSSLRRAVRSIALASAWLLVALAWSNPWHGMVGEVTRWAGLGTLGILAAITCLLRRDRLIALGAVTATCGLVAALAVVDLAAGLPLDELLPSVVIWSLASAVLFVGMSSLGPLGPQGPVKEPRGKWRAWAWLPAVPIALFVADRGRENIDACRVAITMAKLSHTGAALKQSGDPYPTVPFHPLELTHWLTERDLRQLETALPPHLDEGVQLPGVAGSSRVGRVAVLDAWGRGLCVGAQGATYMVISSGAGGRAGPPIRKRERPPFGPIVEQTEQDLVFSTGSFLTYPEGHRYRFDRRPHRWLLWEEPAECLALFEGQRHYLEQWPQR